MDTRSSASLCATPWASDSRGQVEFAVRNGASVNAVGSHASPHPHSLTMALPRNHILLSLLALRRSL